MTETDKRPVGFFVLSAGDLAEEILDATAARVHGVMGARAARFFMTQR